MASCRGCPDVYVMQWTGVKHGSLHPLNIAPANQADVGSWRPRLIPAAHLCTRDLSNRYPHALEESQVCIVLASANAMRACPRCRLIFTDALCMPDVWWSDFTRKSNGYFGSQLTRNAGVITGYNTWAYFETKHLEKSMQYVWKKENVFARWLPQTKQTVITFFDAYESAREHITNGLLRLDPLWLGDPFWIYIRLATEATRLEDAAVWAVRDRVREEETRPLPKGWLRPDYRRLHDISRHAIHVSETLDVATQTLDEILAEHEAFIARGLNTDSDASRDIHNCLRFLRRTVASLRHRSASNEKRLLNEIQLAFNIVAQNDADISLQISGAAQSDGAAMKTVAFVTLAFLPPTFVSALFSMSFFNFSEDTGWEMSHKIWIYWAFALPITMLSFLLWYCWSRVSYVASPAKKLERHAGRLSDLTEATIQLRKRHSQV